MSNMMLPGPGSDEPQTADHEQADDADHGAAAGHRHKQRRPKESEIPSIEECLRALAQVPGLVAIGILEPAQANAIRATFREILQHHRSKAKEPVMAAASNDLLEALRNDPKTLNLLEPLLTQEQIDSIVKNA